jgi:hypothetical protein
MHVVASGCIGKFYCDLSAATVDEARTIIVWFMLRSIHLSEFAGCQVRDPWVLAVIATLSGWVLAWQDIHRPKARYAATSD